MPEPLHHELQRHAVGLRDLARDLLRDGHAAEDVTQAALHSALTHRGLRDGPLGGWLHRTVVNFARQWQRGERRRSAREAGLPTPDPVPAVAEQLARREMLQRVTDAVLRLDEPYQTAVFLRYFEDLPPRAIARRTGANVATVKSRLARGLAMLRARLDHPDGERDPRWRRALALTFGLPAARGPWPLPTGTLLVSAATKSLFVAVAVCAGGVLLYQFGDDPAPAAMAPASPAANAPAATAAATGDAEARAANERTEVAAAASAAVAWLDHPFEIGLDVLLLDPLGLPVPGHRMRLAPIGCALNDAEQTTGPDGRVALTWRSRQRTVVMQVEDQRGQVRRVTLQHGQRPQLALLGNRPATAGTFRLKTRALAAKSTDRTTEQLATKFTQGDMVRGSEVILFGSIGGSPDLRMRAGLHPAALFGDPLGVVAAEPGPDLTIAGERLASVSEFRLSLGARLDGALSKGTPDTATIAGVVFGVDGKPAGKVHVALLGSSPQPLQRVETDEQGRFEFANVVPGEFTVRAGGDREGLATAATSVERGVASCTLQLQRGASVSGRAATGAGQPLANHLVEWRALDGTWADATRTGDDGAFVLANLPGGPGALFLFAREGSQSIPIATLPSVLIDTHDAVLSADPARGSVLRVEPPADGGAPALRVWHGDTGLALDVPAPEQGAVWSSPRLPAGFYDLELRLAGAGTKPLGRHWLDGEHDFELGRVEAPRSGSVRISIPAASLPAAEAQRALEIGALRPDLDVRAEPVQPPLDRSIRLPVGAYVLSFRHADGAVRHHRFEVVADVETVVAPAP